MKRDSPKTGMPALLRLLCVLIGSTLSALAYAPEGHEIIAEVAQDLIKGTPAEKHVAELLAPDTMTEVSTWADVIKDGPSPDAGLNAWRDANLAPPEGKTAPRHSLHHYTNIPFQETSYSPDYRGTGPEDIIHAMRDCIAILQGRAPSDSFRNTSPRVALILLIHYAGDLAQPLHVGEGYLNPENQWVNPKDSPNARGTAGGNRLTWDGLNLHYYWDKLVVDGAMRAAGFTAHPKKYARFLASQTAKNRPRPKEEVKTWPLLYAAQMLPKVRPVYENIKVINFDGKAWITDFPSDAYNNMAVEMTGENLRLGGEQLAEILQGIWPE